MTQVEATICPACEGSCEFNRGDDNGVQFRWWRCDRFDKPYGISRRVLVPGMMSLESIRDYLLDAHGDRRPSEGAKPTLFVHENELEKCSGLQNDWELVPYRPTAE